MNIPETKTKSISFAGTNHIRYKKIINNKHIKQINNFNY